jgi:peptidoglycan hydrolase-like protein with peptidoglycan-binding domain
MGEPNLQLGGSVGKEGSNSAENVKLVQALLNVYLRREGKKVLAITGKSDPGTLSAVETFQKTEQKRRDQNLSPSPLKFLFSLSTFQ